MPVRGGLSNLVKLDEKFGTGGSNTLSFTNIPQQYRHLYLDLIGRSDVAANNTSVRLTFEASPTAGAYDYELITAAGSAITASENLGASAFIIGGSVAGDNATTGMHGTAILNIFDYSNTNVFKVVGAQIHGMDALVANTLFSSFESGVYESLSAIDRLFLVLAAGNWMTTSRATLYGISG